MAGRLGLSGSGNTRGDALVGRVQAGAEPGRVRRRLARDPAMPVQRTTFGKSVSRGTSLAALPQETLDRRSTTWRRRANAAERTRNGGLVGGTIGGAALLAARGKRVSPRVRGHLDSFGIGSAVVGGGAELYGELARSKSDRYRTAAAAHRAGFTGGPR